MASKSLGTLTLDLVAKTGGFVDGMSKAERASLKWRKKASADIKAVGKTMAGLGVASAAGLAAMTVKLASSGREIQQLATLTNSATTEFQRISLAAGHYGVEQGKIADILKDTNDRIGDFIQTGGGPMKDFFENIAPLVGVTADEFARLSGPDALQLYVSSLEKAGASQQEMTFYMEAMASDATLLLPLLKNGGKELGILGDQAEKAGRVISDIDLSQLEELDRSTKELKASFSGMSNEVVLSALPAVNDLVGTLSDPATVETAKTLGQAIVVSVTAAANAITGAINVAKFLGEELASISVGASFDDIARLNEQLELAKSAIENPSERLRFFGPGGVIEYWDEDELNAEIARLEVAIGAGYKRINDFGTGKTPVIDPVGGAKTTPARTGIGSPVKTETNAIEAQIKALKLQAETIRMSKSVAALYKLEIEGATVAQLQSAQAALESIDAFKQQDEAQKEAAAAIGEINQGALQVAEGMKSQEQIILESYERRKQIVLDNTIITGEARTKLLVDLEKKMHKDLEAENAGYWDRYLAAAEENLTNFDQITADTIGNFSSSFAGAIESMVFDAETLDEAIYDLVNGMARSMVSALAEMGAQWLAYQAVQLLVGKTAQASAATAITSNAAAASVMASLNAFSSTAAIPIVGPALAPAAAAAAQAVTAPMAATVAALSLSGMAHDGLMSVPTTGTYILEKGERVTTAETSAKLDQTLNNVQSNMQGGGGMGGVRIVNIESTDAMANYMGSNDGERTVVNHLRRNKRLIQSLATG